ncbi:hypothetical protein [Sandarakinorhabdus oryzae]|uniref:hypothetical protein n=1 Tax=Sandarakinorhabdus oryzae TaxID=2675220 RepID=UPI0018CC75A2|nr:hypothetical protein [Sandarakinorhabdus oryzae]
MPLKPITLLLLVAGTMSLAACEKKVTDAQADAVRDTSDAAATDIENKADSAEAKGEATGDAMRDKADAVRDQAEAKADAIEDGKVGATTKTDTMTTTTAPTDPK